MLILNTFNLTIITVVIGLVSLIIASLFDVKTREVPDWLSFGLVAFALGSSLILTIYHGYAHIIINSLIGLGIGVLLGLLMFYTGQWGGGDAKLIIGLSALIGFSISDPGRGVQSIPFLILFFINILLVGAVYGIIFSIVKAILNFKDFRRAAEKKLRSKEVVVARILLIILASGAFVFLLATRSVESAGLFLLVISLFLFFYLWVFISIVEKACMIRKVRVKDLTEGDWIVNPVVRKNKVILKPTRTGVTLRQLALLKKHRVRKVTIKVGVPFVPSFLIAYILTFILGNWLHYLLL
ncbi:MAG TPA: prepilin peptidase [Candidatus Woesearchaeota archaeon]|nr:prepilin peptidase [Candidatus Woesearchaeota archaeon]